MALLAHSEQIDRAVNSAVQSVSAFSQEVNGSLTLGTGATACIHLLPPLLLQHLRQQHPLLTVGVTTGNTLDIVRAVEENRLDLGLVTLPVQDSLAVTAVVDEEFVVIHPSHEAGIPAVCTPEELQALPLIAFEAGSGTRDLIDRWFRSAGGGHAVMQLGSIEAIKRMVRAGLGYSIVPRMAVEQAEDRYGLTVHSLAPSLYRQLAVVMRQDKVITKGMAEMLRLLQAVRL